ncbi:MAG: hypothetical protein U0894_00675 [Pirellulales bacterium]
MSRFLRGWDRFHLVMVMIALAIVLIGCGESRRGPSTAQQKAPAKRQYGLPPHIPPAPVNISAACARWCTAASRNAAGGTSSPPWNRRRSEPSSGVVG